jgi:hypothetical protein
MLKNIKLFSTDSDRTTYENSASYETPYVSKVIADNSIHYNKVAQLITFYIFIDVHTMSFQAEEGMTWQEWVNSEYNIDSYVIHNSGVWTTSLSGYINNVIPQDVIVANRKYIFYSGGGSCD